MKLFMAMLVYAAVAFILCWGILLTIKGSPWLLIAAVAGYLFALVRIGCLPGKGSH